MELESFRLNIRIFTDTTDSEIHNQAIIDMFDPLDLDLEYKTLASKGNIQKVLDIFSSFSETSDEELFGEYESKRMEQVGVLSQEYFAKKDFSSFSQLIFQLTVESINENYDLGVEDLSLLDISKLYEKIPEDIYLQVFLLENMANPSRFNWNRDLNIIAQSLFALTVCFSDIYAFLSDDADEEFLAD